MKIEQIKIISEDNSVITAYSRNRLQLIGLMDTTEIFYITKEVSDSKVNYRLDRIYKLVKIFPQCKTRKIGEEKYDYDFLKSIKVLDTKSTSKSNETNPLCENRDFWEREMAINSALYVDTILIGDDH